MTRRSIRAARKAQAKRTFCEPADFDLPEPLAVEPMTDEEAERFGIEYALDAIAEANALQLPGRY